MNVNGNERILSAACIYIKRMFIIIIRCVFYMCAKISFINRYIVNK